MGDGRARVSGDDADVNDTSQAAEFRYAVIGLLLEGETRVRQGIQRLEQATAEATQRVTRTVDPNGWPAPRSPLGRGLDRFLSRRQDDIARWREAGRQAEHEGRLTAREALSSSTHEVFGYMAQEPQVRDLIEQQGVTMASTRWAQCDAHRHGGSLGGARCTAGARYAAAGGARSAGSPCLRARSPVAQPQVAAVTPEEPAAKPSPVAGQVQWAMNGPTEVC